MVKWNRMVQCLAPRLPTAAAMVLFSLEKAFISAMRMEFGMERLLNVEVRSVCVCMCVCVCAYVCVRACVWCVCVCINYLYYSIFIITVLNGRVFPLSSSPLSLPLPPFPPSLPHPLIPSVSPSLSLPHLLSLPPRSGLWAPEGPPKWPNSCPQHIIWVHSHLHV